MGWLVKYSVFCQDSRECAKWLLHADSPVHLSGFDGILVMSCRFGRPGTTPAVSRMRGRPFLFCRGAYALVHAGSGRPVRDGMGCRSQIYSRFHPSVAVCRHGCRHGAASFLLLARAMKTLPVGTAYAVWTGIGTAGAFIAGVFLFGETVSLPRLLFLAMILVGIAGLKGFS